MGSQDIPHHFKFLFAAAAGIGSTLICYPLDFIKYRLQVRGEGVKIQHISVVGLVREVTLREGVLSIYSGLSASLLRQALYTGVRMGSFQAFVDSLTVKDLRPPMSTQALCGILSGILGGVAGLPPDVALTRMAADGYAPAGRRRNYKNVIDAVARIFREEGSATLFRGFNAMMVRAVTVNVCQLLSYGQAKKILLGSGLQDNWNADVIASIISAIVTTTACLPADVAKTRIQNMRIIDGKAEYGGLIDAWVKIANREGVFALWKGITPLLLRNGPQFIVLFLINENLLRYYRKYRTGRNLG